jgi:hypothetical protein
MNGRYFARRPMEASHDSLTLSAIAVMCHKNQLKYGYPSTFSSAAKALGTFGASSFEQSSTISTRDKCGLFLNNLSLSRDL